MNARENLSARVELRVMLFELLLRNGFSLNNPEPFKAALDRIEDMVLGGADSTGDETIEDETNEAETSRGNPAGAPEPLSKSDPAKAGKGKK